MSDISLEEVRGSALKYLYFFFILPKEISQ